MLNPIAQYVTLSFGIAGVADKTRPQCSQRSGAPVGPDGGTEKSHGPDRTAKCGPHPSWEPQDGRLCGRRWALQGKTF